MTRSVPSLLQAHYDKPLTTTARLVKIKGSGDFSPLVLFGLTDCDHDIEYDDGSGDGPVIYSTANGFDPTQMTSDVAFSVANAEAYALLADSVEGVTEEMVRAGALDDAEWCAYEVNYRDLTAGRHVLLDSGDVGRIRLKDGTLWMPELFSYGMRLKQKLGSVWSRTCRATYGSDANSRTGCGVDITGLWTSGAITAVGLETDRDFTGTATATLPATNYPARLQFLTGDNAGREFAVEEVDGLDVSLLDPTLYPMQVGDLYRMRRDCAKRYQEDCIDINDNGPNFKGEPLIPVGDAAQAQTPGAQLPGGGGIYAALVEEIIDPEED